MEDYRIVPKLRKGKVLVPSRFGCLQGIPTLNITSGCIFQCAYCYARGYSQAPKAGEVNLYVNLPTLLEVELSRKKTVPPWVILNTSSDCFQTHPDILDVTFKTIQILLDHQIGISFLTKGAIPQRFIQLFEPCRDKVLAQIGLVSLSERYWMQYEPGTPSPEKRLENIQRLKEAGILPEVRIDPIIPFVTDTEPEMEALFIRLKTLGIRKVTLELSSPPSCHSSAVDEGAVTASSKVDRILFWDSGMGNHRLFFNVQTSSSFGPGAGVRENKGDFREIRDPCIDLPMQKSRPKGRPLRIRQGKSSPAKETAYSASTLSVLMNLVNQCQMSMLKYQSKSKTKILEIIGILTLAFL